MDEKFRVTTFSEVVTGGGQFLNFQCRPEDVEEVQDLFELVYSVTIPNHTTVIPHGGYGKASRYHISQHDYAGGGNGAGGGFIEVLQIENPPDNRHGIVIYEWTTYKSWFTEWETLEQAREVFKRFWGGRNNEEIFKTLPGFKRFVQCGPLTPWFYAIGDELLQGDYTFPQGLNDDPVFRFGTKFIVPSDEHDGCFQIKTCMGCRTYASDDHYRRTVYWHDGSKSEEWSSNFHQIQPLQSKDVWIDEAVQQFIQLLNGNFDEFTINFLDGTKLDCQLKKDKKLYTVEGNYQLCISFKDGKKPLQGNRYFKPSEQFPDLFSELTDEAKRAGVVIEKIEVLKVDTTRSGKKWKGVFFGK